MGKGTRKIIAKETTTPLNEVDRFVRCEQHHMHGRCVLEEGHDGDHAAVWPDDSTRCDVITGDGRRCKMHSGHPGVLHHPEWT